MVAKGVVLCCSCRWNHKSRVSGRFDDEVGVLRLGKIQANLYPSLAEEIL